MRTGVRNRQALIGAAVAAMLLALGVAIIYLTRGSGSSPGTVTSAGALWVSADGDDNGPGSVAQPWRTLGHAVETAAAGSTIFIRNGTYPPFAVGRKGLKISSAPGERATIAGRSGVRDVILIAADDVSLTDLTVTGCVPEPKPNVNEDGDHGSGIRVDKASGVTVRNVIVRDSHGVNLAGLPVGCYGILATASRDVLVASSEIYHNGAGIQVTRGGRGTVVEDNNVHDQDVIVQNSTAALDDFGGYGLGATFVTDKPGPIFRRNTVVRNFGPSTDYGVDGGGAEIYDAANTTVTANTFSDNDGVLETGSGNSGRCADNVFSDNNATGRSGVAGPRQSIGLILRCGTNMVIRGNTFTHLDRFGFLFATDDAFAGKVDGLTIESNTVNQRSGAVVYRMQFGSRATPALSVDRNRYRSAQHDFAVIDDGTESTVSFDDWKSRTGFDARSAMF